MGGLSLLPSPLANLFELGLEPLVIRAEQPVRPVSGSSAKQRFGNRYHEEVSQPRAIARRLLGVSREIPLQRTAHLGTIIPQLSQGSINLFGKHRLWKRIGCAKDDPLALAEDPLRAPKRNEGGSSCYGSSFARAPSDLGPHVHRGTRGGLQHFEILAEDGSSR